VALPFGTSFQWLPETVLDLNTHYVNYSSSVLKCENYINIYTQPKNTALHHMQTGLYIDPSIYIPNDGADHTFTQEEYENTPGDMYVWSMMSHTHKWGKDYDIWHRNPDGSKGDKIYDASNMGGDPNGVTIGYDYQHPPTKRWGYPFLRVPLSEGLIHEAVFNNTGVVPVSWGPSSDDEMMIMGLMFLNDTTGLGNTALGIKENNTSASVSLYPNPSKGLFRLKVNKRLKDGLFRLIDLTGRSLWEARISSAITELQTPSGLEGGIYFYLLEDNGRPIDKGKVIIQ